MFQPPSSEKKQSVVDHGADEDSVDIPTIKKKFTKALKKVSLSIFNMIMIILWLHW